MSASRETIPDPQPNVVKVKSACATNISPTSKFSKLFFESPSQIAHF